MTDARTIAAYQTHVDAYAARFDGGAGPGPALRAFIARLQPGADVLDLGCGAGASAAMMRDAGLRVDAVDAAPAMVAHARAVHGLEARVARFEDIDAQAAYDGVWANFSLLHAPRAALPGHLAALRRAMRDGGPLHLGMKLGQGEARDRLDRFYTYYDEPTLRALLAEAGFAVDGARIGEESGLAGPVEPWITLAATAV